MLGVAAACNGFIVPPTVLLCVRRWSEGVAVVAGEGIDFSSCVVAATVDGVFSSPVARDSQRR